LDSSVIVYQEVSKRKLSTGLSDPVWNPSIHSMNVYCVCNM
jgi:hypothetical protein